jgi:hypothetical protein
MAQTPDSLETSSEGLCVLSGDRATVVVSKGVPPAIRRQ